MPAHDFQFALALSDEPRFDAMLSDLLTAVLEHVGYSADAIAELASVLRGALEQGVVEGRRQCRVTFAAAGGQLQIAVAYDPSAEWRTTRPLP